MVGLQARPSGGAHVGDARHAPLRRILRRPPQRRRGGRAWHSLCFSSLLWLAQRPHAFLLSFSSVVRAPPCQAAYANGECPLIDIPGFAYPVEERFLEDIAGLTAMVPGNLQRHRDQAWTEVALGLDAAPLVLQ